eukprot:1146793-Pelagomonas_calceolata.AAC.4
MLFYITAVMMILVLFYITAVMMKLMLFYITAVMMLLMLFYIKPPEQSPLAEPGHSFQHPWAAARRKTETVLAQKWVTSAIMAQRISHGSKRRVTHGSGAGRLGMEDALASKHFSDPKQLPPLTSMLPGI